jgi:hypothetical protein
MNALARFLPRLRLTLRYWHVLGYSWRIAWIKAGWMS